MSDPSGKWPRWATIALGVVAAVAAAAVYAGDIVYSAVTGDSPLKDTVFRGNEDAYNTGLVLISIATGGMLELAAQSPGVCFVGGTAVLTAAGYVAIEDIKTGDMVWSEDTETGEKEIKKVVQTFVNETDELVYVYVDGDEIVTTPEHPFYVPSKGWTGAIHLRTGDILILQNGEYAIVEKTQHELLESPIKVYNFEVADFHTYFVGENSILVHNSCEKMGTQKGNAPWSNQAQNKQFQSVVNEYGLNKSQARILHDAISGQGYNRKEIVDELISIFSEKG